MSSAVTSTPTLIASPCIPSQSFKFLQSVSFTVAGVLTLKGWLCSGYEHSISRSMQTLHGRSTSIGQWLYSLWPQKLLTIAFPKCLDFCNLWELIPALNANTIAKRWLVRIVILWVEVVIAPSKGCLISVKQRLIREKSIFFLNNELNLS
jgi:hypothetical protein